MWGDRWRSCGCSLLEGVLEGGGIFDPDVDADEPKNLDLHRPVQILGIRRLLVADDGLAQLGEETAGDGQQPRGQEVSVILSQIQLGPVVVVPAESTVRI